MKNDAHTLRNTRRSLWAAVLVGASEMGALDESQAAAQFDVLRW